MSTLYCIEGYGKSIRCESGEVLDPDRADPEVFFERGLTLKKKKVEASKTVLKTIQSTMLFTANRAYCDTVGHGLSRFYRDYDVEYGAHLNGGSVDYPLCRQVLGVTGLIFITLIVIDGFSDAFLKLYPPK